MIGARRILALFGGVALAAGTALAADRQGAPPTPPVVEVGPAEFQPTTPPVPVPRRSDLVLAAPRLPADARHDLGELSVAERARLTAPEGRGTGARAKRTKIGLSRPLPTGIGFRALPADVPAGASRVVGGGLLEKAADGSLAWTASFSSSGAGRLRLYLTSARLPSGSLVYVYGGSDEVHGPYDFSSGTRPEGFWTNTVVADTIVLEVRIPASAPASDLAKAFLVVGGLVHVEHPVFAPSTKASPTARPKSDACFVDRSCVTLQDWPNVDAASNAVASLEFTDQGKEYICTGSLINTSPQSNNPYLLTANHCFDNQPAATSLQATWQYRTASCNGPVPDEALFQFTLGSTLLATADASTASDYTFVLLSQPPPVGSVLLGWTTANFFGAPGLVGYRLSHPISTDQTYVVPQIFTRDQLLSVPVAEGCNEAPPTRFLYEKDIQGGTGGGSSGSPLMLEDLRVIGQEYGGCGTNTDDNCDNVNNFSVDGAFSLTFPALKQWLQPNAPGACTANATTLCFEGARFRVTVFYATPDGASGAGMAVSLTDDSGYFWFFSADNIELVVKVLNGCGGNNKYWVFTGGLTNVGVTLVVEDTLTGATQTYPNPVGNPYIPLQATNAFACQ